jgi:hypothetical protein
VPLRLLAGFDSVLVSLEKMCAAPELLPCMEISEG